MLLRKPRNAGMNWGGGWVVNKFKCDPSPKGSVSFATHSPNSQLHSGSPFSLEREVTYSFQYGFVKQKFFH